MTKNIDKRIIDKGFHTGYEVDFVTIQQSDYEHLKEQAELVQELREENRRVRQMKYHEAYEQGKFDTNMKVWYEMPKLEQQNKRYREAFNKSREIWDKAYENYKGNKIEYLDGMLDGAKFIIDIFEKTLEGESE